MNPSAIAGVGERPTSPDMSLTGHLQVERRRKLAGPVWWDVGRRYTSPNCRSVFAPKRGRPTERESQLSRSPKDGMGSVLQSPRGSISAMVEKDCPIWITQEAQRCDSQWT